MKNEPVVLTTFAGGTVVSGLISFAMKMGWVHFTDHQRWILMTFFAMVLPPVSGFIARQWVSPTAKLAPAVNAIKTIAAQPETKTVIKEGEQVISDIIAHAPAESGVAVAVTPAPAPVAAPPDGAPAQAAAAPIT